MYVPSGDQTGLKLNRGFTILDGKVATFTIDFDVRKSVVEPQKLPGAYKLKPTLRIVEDQNAGHITGTVGNDTRTDVNCTVYAFTGSGTTPDDVDGIEPDPISTSQLSGTFEYEIGFLEQGSYTLAVTCQAAADNNEINDAINFIGAQTVIVEAGEITTANFD